MKRFCNILAITLSLILISCHTTNEESEKTTELAKPITNFKKSVILVGKGESEIASYYLDWNIKVLENDSIVMLSSLKQNENDIRSNNRQYYGRVIKSDKYSFEIQISKYLAADGCVKPSSKYRHSDSIPFYIDSTLFNSMESFDLVVQKQDKKDTITVNSLYFVYGVNTKSQNTEIIMDLIPNLKSGFYPIVIKSGLKCGVSLTDNRVDNKYYLNKTKDEYELIIDETIPKGMIGKDCDYCIKTVPLETN